MSLGLRLLTPAEVAEQDEYLRLASIAHAWHQWALSCCTERGGHWEYPAEYDAWIDLEAVS